MATRTRLDSARSTSRRLATGWGWVGALLLVAGPAGCGDAGEPPGCAIGEDPRFCSTTLDAGTPGPSADADAGPADADVSMPPDTGDRRADTGSPPPTFTEGADADYAGVTGSCFNGEDDDGNGLIDCAEPACGAVGSCCIGRGTEACCQTSSTLDVPFDACGSGRADPLSCVAGASLFGSPLPFVLDGAFVPNGDATDSGMVLGAPVDARAERVVLAAEIAAPVEPCGTCLDAVAVGLGPDPAGASRYRPDAAVLVSASRGDVGLMVAGEVVQRWPLGDDASHTYRLELSPDGAVALQVDGRPLGTGTYVPRADARVVLFGRTDNPPSFAPPPARVSRVELLSGPCDLPEATARSASPLIPWASSPSGARAPSAVRWDEADEGAMRIAFEADGDIHLARPEGGGLVFAGSGDLGTPVVEAEAGDSFARVANPSLYRDTAASVWRLYFDAEDSAGRRRVVVATSGPGFDERAWTRAEVALPSDAEVLGFEAPSVVEAGAEVLMVVAARTATDSRIVMLREDAMAATPTFGWYGTGLEGSTLVASRGEEAGAFDRDEVSDPELLVDARGIYRLYYAGRRGTRWAIGLALSDNVTHWRRYAEEPILAGSGAGHDALGVRGPSVVRRLGRLETYYTAIDGAEDAIGRADGVTP